MLVDRLGRKILVMIFIAVLINCDVASAQTINKVVSDSSIKIEVDESGKIIALRGFALVKERDYNFNITVGAPVKQHQKVLTSLLDKLDSTYEKLNNTADYQYSTLYRYLWGDSTVDRIKNQVKALADILRTADPKSSLLASSDSFPLFISKNFLLDNLFGDIFHLKCSLDNTVYTAAYNVNLCFSITTHSSEDTLKVDFFVEDMEKHFYRNFFTESRRLVETELNRINPAQLYTEAKGLRAFKNVLDSLRQVLEKSVETYVCNYEVIKCYQETVSSIEDIDLLSLLRTGWMKAWVLQWIWSMKGSIALNPLPFTEEKFLSISSGYDTLKAQAYDAYRKSALEQMKTSVMLNEAKINYSAYDSLLKQEGGGNRVFSFQPRNEEIIKSNKENAKKAQTKSTFISSLKFPLVEDQQKGSFLFRHYNASDKLKGSKQNDVSVIANQIKVIAVGYNIGAKEIFSIKESPEEVKNESKAISQLTAVGDGINDLFSKTTPLTGILQNIRLAFRRPDHFVPSGTILDQVIVTGYMGSNLSKRDYTIYFYRKYETDRYILLLKNDKDRTIESESLDGALYRTFADRNNDCEYLLYLYHYQLRGLLFNNPKIFRNKTSSSILAHFQATRKDILHKADSISRVVANAKVSLERQRILRQLNSYIAIIDLLSSPEFFTLPPKKYDLKDSEPGVARYRNEFIAFAEEKKAINKNTSIILTDNSTKSEFKITDSYKTAPTQRLTYSLGVIYVLKSFRRSEVVIQDNKITNTADEEQIRIMAALHYHLKPIILADDRPIWKLNGNALKSRISVLAGVSFPKPLYNPHFGLGIDIWTGIKITSGIHFYHFTDYTILNGQIADQDSKYIYNGMFFGLNIEPATFVKFLAANIFK